MDLAFGWLLRGFCEFRILDSFVLIMEIILLAMAWGFVDALVKKFKGDKE